jgi:quercetin dioxygenase-like cupin family protein
MDKSYVAQSAGQGKQLNITGDPFICKVVGRDTENGWALFEATVLPGSIVPPHKHDGFDEAFYILEGEIEMSVEGETVTAPAGYFINIHRGTVHGYQNKRSEAARYLTWTHPAGVEHFYEEISENVKTMPDDLGKILTIAEKHQIQIMPFGEE